MRARLGRIDQNLPAVGTFLARGFMDEQSRKEDDKRDQAQARLPIEAGVAAQEFHSHGAP